ncbi:hypothetical protein [Sulfurovum lithotrophicum]|uniref:hypothetical protein n=1 Tax=Sulfurovum lithotrophicum TaxID=206403 RepID=UPI0012B76759|nr:hypothetical protein [Sulfurovum lithotrophicum]
MHIPIPLPILAILNSYCWNWLHWPLMILPENRNYDMLGVTMGHKMFKELGRSKYESISIDEPVLIGIKGIMEDPTWRL